MNRSKENVCLCCLLRGPEKDLKATYNWLGKKEVYYDMLKECFEINLSCDDNTSKPSICEVCVTRLRDACDFKNQVLTCQKDLLEKTMLTDIKVESAPVKMEFIEDSDDDIYMDFSFTSLSDIQNEDVTIIKVSSPKNEKIESKTEKPSTVCKSIKGVKGRTTSKRRKQTAEEKDAVKQITQRYVQKVLAERLKKDQEDAIKKDLKTKILNNQQANSVKLKKSLSEFNLPLNSLSKRRLMNNLTTLLKYSNCTPFRHKNLSGYGCAYCKEYFPDPKDLRNHNQANHRNDILRRLKDINSLAIKIDINNLTCGICSCQIKDIKTLKTHLASEHNKKFYDVKDFVLEFKLNLGESYDCVHCNSKFETFKMLLQHMNNHYRNYICDVCGMGFINMTKLKTHKTCHETGEFNCQFCEKVFPNLIKKAYHEKFTHTRVRYSSNCPHCNESFTSYYKRNQHMILVHNSSAASYKCNICEKSFILKAHLTNHTKKVHLMERNHICPECGQAFYQKQYLREHMIKHSGERIHKCDVCHKSYARKKTLREHMRIHNNDRRHKCHVCGMAFVQKCSLKSHLLSNHGVHLNGES